MFKPISSTQQRNPDRSSFSTRLGTDRRFRPSRQKCRKEGPLKKFGRNGQKKWLDIIWDGRRVPQCSQYQLHRFFSWIHDSLLGLEIEGRAWSRVLFLRGSITDWGWNYRATWLTKDGDLVWQHLFDAPSQRNKIVVSTKVCFTNECKHPI